MYLHTGKSHRDLWRLKRRYLDRAVYLHVGTRTIFDTFSRALGGIPKANADCVNAPASI